MIVIRRMVDRRRAYTAIFLKGEPPKIFPTSDAEHARILQVYKQDRPHEGILNDFAETDLPASSPSPLPHAAPAPWPLAPRAKKTPSPRTTAPQRTAKKSPAPAKPSPRGPAAAQLWLAVVPLPQTAAPRAASFAR